MSLMAMIGWFFIIAIIAGLTLHAVAHMVVYGMFREPSQDEDCGDAGGYPMDTIPPPPTDFSVGPHEQYVRKRETG